MGKFDGFLYLSSSFMHSPGQQKIRQGPCPQVLPVGWMVKLQVGQAGRDKKGMDGWRVNN